MKRYYKHKDGHMFCRDTRAFRVAYAARSPSPDGFVDLYNKGYLLTTKHINELMECDEYGNPPTPKQPVPNPKRHPHADLIHAWAEGAEIQIYCSAKGVWLDVEYPGFLPKYQYRIKPELSKERAELAEVEQVSKLQAELQRRMGELEPLIDKRDALRKVVRNG